MSVRAIILLSFALLLAAPELLATPSDYLEEYNNPGENCSADDLFTMIAPEGRIATTILVCCENTTCRNLVIDENGMSEYTVLGATDALQTYSIRLRMRRGEFNEEEFYHLGDTFEICSFFDLDVLRDQGIAIGTEGVELGAEIFYPQQAKKVKEVTGLLKGFGIVSKINPAALTASVVCTANIGAQQDAVQKVADCYVLAKSIRYGEATYGAVGQLERCNGEAKALIDEVTKSLTQQVISATNTVVNFFAGMIDMAKEPEKGLEIKKTTLQQLEDIGDRIKENPVLKHPDAFSVASQSVARFSEKKAEASSAIQLVEVHLADVKETDRSTITYWLQNVFQEPNLNYTRHKETIQMADQRIDLAKGHFERKRFNSATKAAAEVELLSLDAEKQRNDLNTIIQSFDRRWKNGLLIVALTILIAWLVGRYLLREARSNQ